MADPGDDTSARLASASRRPAVSSTIAANGDTTIPADGTGDFAEVNLRGLSAVERGMPTSGRDYQPISSYGMLADCHTAALVSTEGSIDWLCLPHYDSPAVFCRMLDPDAGHWSLRPTGDFQAHRRYLPGSLVLETTFTTSTGSVRLTDALAFAAGQRGHDLGLEAPHQLLRS